MRTNPSNRADQGLPGDRREGGVTKEHQVTLEARGMLIIFNVVMDLWVYKCQNLSNYTLAICAVYCVSLILQ